VLDGRMADVVQDVGVGVNDAQLRVVRPHSVRVTVQIDPDKTALSKPSRDVELTSATSTAHSSRTR